ncbi:MAG: UDP-N-acetylmuramoyl-L-alanine--D-glutamate ligase [Bradymonadaceae bacterium]
MVEWLDFERFAVLGLGKSGIAAANLLARRGKTVTASDSRKRGDLEAALGELDSRVRVICGENSTEAAEVVVVSPGLRPTLPIIADLLHREVPVISEVELAFSAARAPFMAITGTDGKTTTATLTGRIFEQARRAAIVAGNIGTALCGVVDEVGPDGLIIAEVSSFQLWSIHDFRPQAAAFTNVAADHLDYHGTVEEYVRCKRRLLKNMQETDWLVFNAEDPRLVEWAREFPGKSVGYGTYPFDAGPFDLAMWYEEGRFFGRDESGDVTCWLETVDDLPLKGRHNRSNMLCAAALARTRGVSWDDIVLALQGFVPLPHRLEPCGEVEGVRFYDDSKATNSHAALAGLRSLSGPIVPIVGGVDKGLDLEELVVYLRDDARAVVLMGEIASRLHEELLEAGMEQERIVEVMTMDEAVEEAFRRSDRGGTVTLSPACSSFDMFESYAHRGRAFQTAVRGLEGSKVTLPQ